MWLDDEHPAPALIKPRVREEESRPVAASARGYAEDSWEGSALFFTLLAFFPLLVVVIPITWFSLLSKVDEQPEAKGLFKFVSVLMGLLVLGGVLLALLAGPMTAAST